MYSLPSSVGRKHTVEWHNLELELEFEYKGYSGRIFFSPEANSFCGEILNSKEVIACLASTLEDAVLAMQESVDDYLLRLPASVSMLSAVSPV